MRLDIPLLFNHLGDHLRKRRLDLGLQMKQAARLLGAHAQSLANWEEGRTAPALHHIPKLIHFVGYDLRPVPTNLAERLTVHRIGLGLPQREMAKRLGVDPGTLSKWETGQREPAGPYLARVELALKG